MIETFRFGIKSESLAGFGGKRKQNPLRDSNPTLKQLNPDFLKSILSPIITLPVIFFIILLMYQTSSIEVHSGTLNMIFVYSHLLIFSQISLKKDTHIASKNELCEYCKRGKIF